MWFNLAGLRVSFFLCCVSIFAVVAQADTTSLQPEAATGWYAKQGWQFKKHAVAAANPLAAQAGQTILAQGGNALDAAIATQLVLSLVEPQSSGLGGGGFLLSWHEGELIAWDGRETAPASVNSQLFLDAQQHPKPFQQAVLSSTSVGVPGLVRMLEAAHQRQGQLPWEQLFIPAINLAEQGFALSPRLHQLLQQDSGLRNNPAARKFYYTPEGEAWPIGTQLRNPALAAVLRQIATQGADVFYQGKIAASIQAASPNINAEDLTTYQAIAHKALCSPWRTYLICGQPPPAAGHLAIMQILGILDALPKAKQINKSQDFYSAAGLHTYFSAANLAFADRNLYVADSKFVQPPAGAWLSLLNKNYLAARAQLVGAQNTAPYAAGQPQSFVSNYGAAPFQPESGTTHLSVIDAAGNGVALTSSVEQAFGSRILVDGGTGLAGGFLLNNQLTDFSFQAVDAAGKPIANRPEAGKRPRSSMAPTLVFDAQGKQLIASLGSPGGAGIIHFTAKTLLASLGWQLSPQAAINLPNVASFNTPTHLVEAGQIAPSELDKLKQLGYQVRETSLTSGVQMLLITPEGIFGGADPRREGLVVGE